MFNCIVPFFVIIIVLKSNIKIVKFVVFVPWLKGELDVSF